MKRTPAGDVPSAFPPITGTGGPLRKPVLAHSFHSVDTIAIGSASSSTSAGSSSASASSPAAAAIIAATAAAAAYPMRGAGSPLFARPAPPVARSLPAAASDPGSPAFRSALVSALASFAQRTTDAHARAALVPPAVPAAEEIAFGPAAVARNAAAAAHIISSSNTMSSSATSSKTGASLTEPVVISGNGVHLTVDLTAIANTATTLGPAVSAAAADSVTSSVTPALSLLQDLEAIFPDASDSLKSAAAAIRSSLFSSHQRPDPNSVLNNIQSKANAGGTHGGRGGTSAAHGHGHAAAPQQDCYSYIELYARARAVVLEQANLIFSLTTALAQQTNAATAASSAAATASNARAAAAAAAERAALAARSLERGHSAHLAAAQERVKELEAEIAALTTELTATREANIVACVNESELKEQLKVANERTEKLSSRAEMLHQVDELREVRLINNQNRKI